MTLAKGESNEDSEKDYELFEAKLRGLRSLLLELSIPPANYIFL